MTAPLSPNKSRNTMAEPKAQEFSDRGLNGLFKELRRGWRRWRRWRHPLPSDPQAPAAAQPSAPAAPPAPQDTFVLIFDVDPDTLLRVERR